jgi:hypothetical protein
MSWLSDLLRGGDDELGWDDLIRRTVEAVAKLRSYGPKGETVFPESVIVRITVPEGASAVVQGFIDRPELDRDVGAALANKCDVASEALPAREYIVSVADRASVTVSQGISRAWRLVIVGGDLDGHTVPLPGTWTELAFGRGPNDIVVCKKTEFVSRRAGRLYRAGHQLEVASLDQGDELVVTRSGGDILRPARTARGRAVIREGDTIELSDGKGASVRLLVQRG